MSEDKDNQVICKACGKEFKTDRQLHAHIKVHDLRVVGYYQKYYPRHDLHDGKIIKYKTKEQYFSTDFNSRTTLRLWLKSRDVEESKEYCKKALLKRKEKKSLIYTPSQTEMRTILVPPIQYYDEIFGNYYSLCDSLGFKNKYKRSN